MSKPVPRNETAVPRLKPVGSSEEVLQIAYTAIIGQVPKELWGRLAPAGVAGASFPVFTQQVLDQLPQGSVKVTFGELRRNAPNGVFTNSAAQDGRVIDLPLAEVLAQIHPDVFARRADQVQIEISHEVPDLFGAKGERLAPLRVLEKKESTQVTSRQNQPASATPGNILPITPSIQTPPAARPTPAPPAAPTPAPAPISAPATAKAPSPVRPSVPAQPAPIPAAPPAPNPVAAAPKPITPAAPAAPKPLPKPVAPVAPPPPPPLFYIALDAIAEQWPPGIRQELARLKMPDAKVGLPPVEVCEGLKRRIIQYPWKTIRGWIHPEPKAAASPYDDVVIGLPLDKLTPLFLDYIRANPVNRRVAAAENITEFFRKAEEATDTSPEMAEALDGLAPAEPKPELEPEPLEEPSIAPPPAIAFQPKPIAPAPPATLPPPPAPAPIPELTAAVDGVVSVPLSEVCGGWSETVTQDINQFALRQSSLEIPAEYVEAGLKVGRVEFSWRQLCAWLRPASRAAQSSINGEVRVVLPLHVLAPLFMKQRGGGPSRRKTNVNQEIPDLFSAAGKPLAEAPAKAVSAPVSAPAPAASAPAAPAAPAASAAPAPLVPRKNPANLNELFNETDKRTWSPNDIVHKSATLPGVAGALIALQDGLLVAACMPPTARTETIAAFIPQIFGRMNQYTKELQLGDNRGIALSVESGTLHIFSAGIIYFAVLSAPDTLLPLPELQLIARELSRHTK